MALENILTALGSAIRSEEIDSALLEEREVQLALTAFAQEHEQRHEMLEVLDKPILIQRYLDLSVEARDALQGIYQANEKSKRFMEGDVNLNAPPKLFLIKRTKHLPEELAEKTIQLYKDCNLSKVFNWICQRYVEDFSEVDVLEVKIPSLSYYIRQYDIKTGKKIMYTIGGSHVRLILDKKGKGITSTEEYITQFLDESKPEEKQLKEKVLDLSLNYEKKLFKRICERYVEDFGTKEEAKIPTLRTYISSYDIKKGERKEYEKGALKRIEQIRIRNESGPTVEHITQYLDIANSEEKQLRDRVLALNGRALDGRARGGA